LYGCYFFIPTLKKQNSGVLINVASAAGFANLPKMASYNITKAAVIALSETLCVELKKYGIQVTVVTPTFFQSNILSQAKGAEKIVNVAQKFINNSSLTETDAAWKVIKGVSKGKFQLIFPLSAKLIWYIKRLSPSFYRLIAYKLFN
jgi:short-subunit dehydrogenase